MWCAKMVAMKNLSDTDIAWLAGVFEGEGCIYAPSHRRGARIAIKMTDKDIIERIDAMFPCPRITPVLPRESHHQVQYAWTITKGDTIEEILELLMPYFGERRKAKGREQLAFLESRLGKGTFNREKTHCPAGHQYSPENTYIMPNGKNKGKRICKTCRENFKRSWRAAKKATSG